MHYQIAVRLGTLSLCIGACTGQIGGLQESSEDSASVGGSGQPGGGVDPQARGDSGPGGDTGSPFVDVPAMPGEPSLRFACDEDAPAWKPRIWRLTPPQIDATVNRYLEGLAASGGGKPSVPFVGEASAYRFDTDQRRLEIESGRLDSLMSYANWVGQQAAERLSQTCRGQGDCVREKIADAERMLFRRPADDDTVAERVQHFDTWQSEAGTDGAFAATITAMVLSPRFLFRSEVGRGGKINSYEVAEALAYSLTGGPPDATLSTLADEDRLTDANLIAEQVERLLESGSGQKVVTDFIAQLFGYRDAANSPKIDPPSGFDARKLVADTDALVADTVQGNLRSGLLTRLLTRHDVFASSDTASLYSVRGGRDTPSSLGQGTARAGVMTQPSWLAAFAGTDHNNPIKRGLFVYEDMACAPFPQIAIPDVEPLTVDDGETLRDALQQHREDPACRGCHALTDPMGFAFEQFDHFGRYRTQDHGQPINAAGEVLATGDVDGAYEGPVELMDKLSQSITVQRCFVARAFTYLAGREPDASDGCALQKGHTAFADGQEDFVGFASRVFTAPVFLTRQEVPQ